MAQYNYQDQEEYLAFYLLREKLDHYLWARFAAHISIEERRGKPEYGKTLVLHFGERAYKLLPPFQPFLTEEI